jgi:hypothetical protein
MKIKIEKIDEDVYVQIGTTLLAKKLLPLDLYVKKPVIVRAMQIDKPFAVKTLEGIMTGKKGDYLIQGVEGEFYPCKETVFKKTYEKVKQ